MFRLPVHSQLRTLCSLLCMVLFPTLSSASLVSGSLKTWHPLKVSFMGPYHDENDVNPNPFLDYRLQVYFYGPSGQVYNVPGFFDGNGRGKGAGQIWSVRFSPDETGIWTFAASFQSGSQVAISTQALAGTPAYFDRERGSFMVSPSDANSTGFLRFGSLEYVGEHYLKFRNGPYFLKGGTDSPENLLGYAGFDNTFDQGGIGVDLWNGLHRYLPHLIDAEPGDPYFQSADHPYDSSGLIGALNYLSNVHVNSVYFLPMNLGGDGQETYPFRQPVKNFHEKTHYDISKLEQWNQVFAHATKKGILLHVVLGETESGNQNWLDNGTLGVERKLFYREMIARFGYNLAIKWNLSEESNFSPTLHQSFAQYIQDVDPFHHPIAFHTHLLAQGSSGSYSPYQAVLGDARFEMTSIQSWPEDIGKQIEYWRGQSAASGQRWAVEYDEQAPAGVGLIDTNADELRKKALWATYLSGGAGIEWYFGYHSNPLGGDVQAEDFRTRQAMWNYMWYARRFMENELPFWQMTPADSLVTGESSLYGGAQVFQQPNNIYAIYFPLAQATGQLNLSGTTGLFEKLWYNPRTGQFEGNPSTIAGGSMHTIGSPPSATQEDWVLLIRR